LFAHLQLSSNGSDILRLMVAMHLADSNAILLVLAHYSEGPLFQRSAIPVSVRVYG